jgi:hypothetical protein
MAPVYRLPLAGNLAGKMVTVLRPRLVEILSLIAALQLLVAVVVLGSHGAPGLLGGDFIAYYGAGRQALAGNWENLYTLPAQLQVQQALLLHSGLAMGRPAIIPFDYPPPAALLFLPLAALPPQGSLALWFAVNIGLIYVSWHLMVSQLDVAFVGVSKHWWSASPLVPFLFLPVDWGLLSGQPVGFMLLFAELSFLALLAKRDVRGGIWLGLLALFKPQLVLVPLLGLLFLRRPRAIVGIALTGLALLGIALVLVGTTGLFAYLQLLGRIDPTLGNASFSISTAAMVNWRAWITALPGIDGRTALALTAAAAAATVGSAGFICAHRRAPAHFAPAYLALTAAGLVSGYHSHYQDLIMLLPPVFAMFVAFHGNLDEVANGRISAAVTVPGCHPGPDVASGENQQSTRSNGFSLHTRTTVRSLEIDPAEIGRLALAAVMLLLVVGPSLSWLLLGVFALGWLHVWIYLTLPGLLLVMVSAWLTSNLPLPASSTA